MNTSLTEHVDLFIFTKNSLTENFIFSAVRGALVQNGLMRSGNELIKQIQMNVCQWI